MKNGNNLILTANDVIRKIISAASTDKLNKTSGCFTEIPFKSFDVKKSYHINDLLKFDNTEFIKNSYLTILNRHADAEGLQYYTEKLYKNKLSKTGVLFRLRYSPEGRYVGVKIKLLSFHFAVSILKRLLMV